MNSAPSSPLDFLGRHRGMVAVLVAAAMVRLMGLGDWWLNPDEGIYYSILTRDSFADFWHEVATNAHPPLYYMLLRFFGYLTWDFLWFRVFSVACGVAAVAGVWVVAARMAKGERRGQAAGFFAALVLTFAPGGIELSQVMRPYMLQLALLTWALAFLLRTLDTSDTRSLVAYTVLTSLALLTHYSSALALPVFGLLVLGHGWSHRGSEAGEASAQPAAAGDVTGPERRPLGGYRDAAWRRLFLAHLVPAAVLGILYVVHLRPLAGSQLADEALAGWLRFYMIDSPGDVWWSVLGFQHLVAAPWLRAPAALALLAGIGIALLGREGRVAILAGVALLVAIVCAALGLYPMGASRHSVWLMAFAVPTLGWFAASLLDVPSGPEARARIAILVLPLLFGGPLGSLVGMRYTPWAVPDQVLRQEDLGRMVDLLDRSAGPGLVVVSEQTFYLLLPFYAPDREAAEFSSDSTVFHFAYGNRQILVSDAWDFTLDMQGDEPGVHSEDGVFAAHLGRFLDAAQRAFPDLGVTRRPDASILVGGWRPAFVGRLQLLDERYRFIRGARSVTGLNAFTVDLPTLRTAMVAEESRAGAR